MQIECRGIQINVADSGNGPALLLLHGFTGSAATWAPFRQHWRRFRLLSVDLIGHGSSSSPADPRRYSIPECIDDLVAVLDSLSIERCALLGYSMGGRVAQRFALTHSNRLWGLVLESTSPGIVSEADRAARRDADEELASRLESQGLESFIDYWQSLPLWASQADLPAALRERLRRQRMSNSVTGLANSLRGMGAGVDTAVHEALSQVSTPTLLLAGELDSRYAQAANAMAESIPAAELQVVAGAGHAIHLEKPAEFGSLTSAFFTRHAPIASREA